MKGKIRFLIFILCLFSSITVLARVKQDIPDAARLQILMRKLTVVGKALFVGAHPDDENTAVLSYLSLGKGVRAGYLSMTRGEGGQNLIGPEQGPLLGLIRTQELLGARRVDGAEQFFARTIDFGFSKTAEETLNFWGKEEALSDVVWIVRKFRPDVIITRFPSQGGGHGNHIASAILAEEAFVAAADPGRFPEQLVSVKPWQAKRIVWNRYSWSGPLSDQEKAESARMEIGDYNPMLGKSYTEVAGVARTMHKSQGFGDSEDRGRYQNFFKHVAGDPAKEDVFEGIDLTWKRIPQGEPVGKLLQEAYDAFRPENPGAVIPLLLQAYERMKSLAPDPLVEEKKDELLRVIQACSGLWLESISEKETVYRGSTVKVISTAVSRSDLPWRLESIELPLSNTVEPVGVSLENNKPVSKETIVQVPPDTLYTQPYWLEQKTSRPLSVVKDLQRIGSPESPAAMQAIFHFDLSGNKVQFAEPVFFRRVDPVEGEQYRELQIVPEITVGVRKSMTVFESAGSKPVVLVVQNHGSEASGEVKLLLPSGWKSDPASGAFQIRTGEQATEIRFDVRPEANAVSGVFGAEVSVGGRKYTQDRSSVSYPHIPSQTYFPAAEGKLVRIDLKTAGKKIGYLMGSGDEVPEALREIGYEVTLLSDENAKVEDLAVYDSIVVGVRAYNTHPGRLKRLQAVLLEYVRNGGTMIVQYQTTQDLDQNGLGPFPFRVSRDRVSVEESAVTFLKPDHPLLHFPNEITESDLQGWVQERGLYFADQWDPQYDPVFECHDPGEPARSGGMLFARHGEGVYIFSAYSWFRQLSAGVPGAYRIFVNMLSAGKADAR